MQSITDVLGQIRGGYALGEAGRELDAVVKAVKATGKKGSVTFTIEVVPDKTDDRIVVMTPSVNTKLPKKGFSPGIFFLGPDGRLTKEDPAQLELLEERRAAGVATLAQNEASLAKVGTGATG